MTTPDTPATEVLCVCEHRHIETFTFSEPKHETFGKVALWACSACHRKFVPMEARSVPTRPDLSCIHKPGHPDDCDDCECVPTRPDCATCGHGADSHDFTPPNDCHATPTCDCGPYVPTRPDERRNACCGRCRQWYDRDKGHVCPHQRPEPLTVERLAAALRQAAGPDGAYPSPARVLAALGIGEASEVTTTAILKPGDEPSW